MKQIECTLSLKKDFLFDLNKIISQPAFHFEN